MAFNAKFKLIIKCRNQDHVFNMDPIRYLMKSCAEESRRVFQTMKSRNIESNMVNFGKWSISVNDRVVEILVREDVKIINAMTSEYNYSF